MDALDGNAIAGALYEWFGTEMTTERGTCKSCGSAQRFAEVRVYSRAPGAVARCKHCGSVVFVVVVVGGATRVHLDGFSLDQPEATPGA